MRRLRRTTRQYILISILCIVLIGGAVAIAYVTGIKQLKGYYEEKLATAEQTIEENMKGTYVSTIDIKQGDKITKGNVIFKEVLSNTPEQYLITEEDLGKISVIDIGENTTILKNMITKEHMDDTLREEEFAQFYLNSNLQDGDYVDIRIIYPNGEDYIVLSKKAIRNLTLEASNCFLWLNEEEILTISSAIVDAYLHAGCKLYTVKYIEPLIQEASIVTYVPNVEVIELIKTDRNILSIASKVLSEDVRTNLDNRLALYKEEHGDSIIDWEKSNEYIVGNDDTKEPKEEYYSEQDGEVEESEEDEFYYVD